MHISHLNVTYVLVVLFISGTIKRVYHIKYTQEIQVVTLLVYRYSIRTVKIEKHVMHNESSVFIEIPTTTMCTSCTFVSYVDQANGNRNPLL